MSFLFSYRSTPCILSEIFMTSNLLWKKFHSHHHTLVWCINLVTAEPPTIFCFRSTLSKITTLHRTAIPNKYAYKTCLPHQQPIPWANCKIHWYLTGCRLHFSLAKPQHFQPSAISQRKDQTKADHEVTKPRTCRRGLGPHMLNKV